AWSRTTNARSQAVRDGHIVPIERYPDPGRDRLMRIDLEPIDPTVLFVPLNAVALDIRPRGEVPIVGPRFLHVSRGPEGEFRYGSVEERGVRYDVFLARQPLVSNQSLGKDERSRYLTLPAGVSPRVVALAEEWTAGLATPLDRARAIEERLRTGYRYDLGSPSSGAPSPLDHFLFESKRGHCEFYSTAMAMLLRVAGVPSRNVTGFVGGTYNRFGRYYAVRQGDAHSWVEAYVDGFGWVTFDPTPPVDVTPRSDIHGLLALLRDILEASGQRWNRHIVGYDLHQQLSLFERVRSWARASTIVPAALRPRLPWATWVGVGVGIGVAFALGRRYLVPARARAPRGSPQERERATGVAISLYENLDSAMASLGVPRPQGTPPLRYAESLALRRHPCADEILQLTKLYLDVRFGGVAFDEADYRAFERRVRALGGRAKSAAAAQRAQEQADAQAQPESSPRPVRRPPAS
ncbi:MAG TPA: transglutaminase domain-containing protein, partial [Polyangiaceae bacterium]|nr:transglutaminase domain-containing protein [Polyangiaceae bacterium]